MTLTDAQAAAQLAEQEANEADALMAELEQRLEAGDDTITAEQLDEQQRLSRWARLRAAGAATKRAEAEAASAIESAKAAIADVAESTLQDAALVEAWTDAVHAIRTLAEKAASRSQTISANSALLHAHRAKLARVASVDLGSLGGLPAMFGGEVGYRLPEHGINVHDVTPAAMLSTAIEAGSGPVHVSSLSLDSSRASTLAGSSLVARVTGWGDAAAQAVSS